MQWNSYEVRGKTARYFPGYFHRVGLTKDKRSVYWFSDLGYWVCPPYITVHRVDAHIRVAYSKTSGERIRIMVDPEDSYKVRRALRAVATHAKYDRCLFSRMVKRSWFASSGSELTTAINQGIRHVYIRLPSSVRDLFGYTYKSIMELPPAFTDEELTALKVMKIKKEKELKTEVRNRITMSMYDAMTFTKSNPLDKEG